ncbi:MAG TPA: hypothetical protein VLQ80_01625 [Candidatus Saccharimonadia bacterium]|nr:hypothetical protein [Candidatus Saccharimonadia bacterium]
MPDITADQDSPTIEDILGKLGPPTVTQWLARYKARMLARGVPEDMAQEAVGAVDMSSGESSTNSLDESPEDAADDEMSYWDDDGE